MVSKANRNGSLGIFFIFLGTLMWALDTLVRYPLLGFVSAFQIVYLEHLYLSIIFLGLLLILHTKKRINLLLTFKQVNKKDALSFLVIGAVGSGFSTLAFTKAFQLINPSVVILLQKLQPFLVILFSAILLKEKLEKRFFIWAGVAIAGTFLLATPDLIRMQWQYFFNSDYLALGYILTLFAVLGWSLSTIFGKHLSNRGYSENVIMSGRFICGFIAMNFYWLGTQWVNLEVERLADVHLKILLMVFLSGILGMYFYYKGLKKVTAHVGSIAELFFPLSVILINWIFLGQGLSWRQLIGALLMVIASVGLSKKLSFI